MIATTKPASAGPPADYNLRYIWLIAVVAALGGLLFGYDWVVIGGAKPFFERFFSLTDAAEKGWANSCALVGCLIGALMAGGLSDKFGRKRLLILSAFLFAVTSLGNGLAPNFTIFVAWRILGGVAIGLASNLSPMYIAEIAPAEMRGRLVAINQLTIVLGIAAAQFVNYLIAEPMPKGTPEEILRASWNCRLGWRWMFAATAAPSLLFFIGMFLVPESPRWLAKNGKPDNARRVFAKIGGDSYAVAAVADIRSTLASEEIQHVRFNDLLEPRMKRVLLLGVILAVFQQWCGINVIFNYAEEIFSAAGYDISETLPNIAWTGSVNLVFTFVALGVVDRGGRRPLMLLGAAGLVVIYLGMGFCYNAGVKGLPMLLLVLGAIGTYAMSLAPVTWVVISEIFPNRIRGAAMSIAVMSLWIACFLLTYTFPILNKGFWPDARFDAHDLRDLPSLAGKLSSPTNAVSQFLWDELSKETQQALKAQKAGSPPVQSLRTNLVTDLNRIIQMNELSKLTAGIQLSTDAQELLTQKARGDTRARLNRLLLEDAFPELVKRRLENAGSSNSRALSGALPFLKHGLGPARTFWLYAAICVGGFLFIVFRLPETKGKTLEQIEKALVD